MEGPSSHLNFLFGPYFGYLLLSSVYPKPFQLFQTVSNHFKLFQTVSNSFKLFQTIRIYIYIYGHIWIHNMDTYVGPRARPWPKTGGRVPGTLAQGQGPWDPGPFGPAASFGPGPGSWAPICIHILYPYVSISLSLYIHISMCILLYPHVSICKRFGTVLKCLKWF